MENKKVKDAVRSSIEDLPSYLVMKQELQTQFNSRSPNPNEIITYIKDHKLCKDILHGIDKQFASTFNKPQVTIPRPIFLNEDFKQLTVKIFGGNEFWEYEDEPIEKMLMLDISFMNKRHITNPINSSINPEFNEVFSFDLIREWDGQINIRKLIANNYPMNFVLIEYNKATNKKKVMSVKRVQWRNAVCNKTIEQEITFYSTHSQIKNSIGKLKVSLLTNCRYNYTSIIILILNSFPRIIRNLSII